MEIDGAEYADFPSRVKAKARPDSSTALLLLRAQNRARLCGQFAGMRAPAKRLRARLRAFGYARLAARARRRTRKRLAAENRSFKLLLPRSQTERGRGERLSVRSERTDHAALVRAI